VVQVGIDCGGPCSTSCCENRFLDRALGEVDVDCGGSCGLCADGKRCKAISDCSGGACLLAPGSRGDDGPRTCAVRTCSDGQQNGDEVSCRCSVAAAAALLLLLLLLLLLSTGTDLVAYAGASLQLAVDCGGFEADGITPCADCCANNRRDGRLGETDVDCGGDTCITCADVRSTFTCTALLVPSVW
jgi:hypothetical protein